VYIGRMKTSKLVFVCLKIKDDVMKEMIRSWSKRRIYKLKKNWNWNCVVGSWIFIKSWNISICIDIGKVKKLLWYLFFF
jgi:hypothetical protein